MEIFVKASLVLLLVIRVVMFRYDVNNCFLDLSVVHFDEADCVLKL